MARSIILTRKVFEILHDKCLELVRHESEAGLDTKIPVRQLYGFDHDTRKPSLKKLIDESQAVQEVFHQKTGKSQVIDGKYLYLRYRELTKGKATISLKRDYTWTYFKILNFDSAEDFVDHLHTNRSLTEKEYQQQKALFNDSSTNIGIFGCYHYSILWHSYGIYSFQLEIDFDSKNQRGNDSIYKVNAISKMDKTEGKPMEYSGEVIHDGKNLFINLIADISGGGLKNMIFPLGTALEDIKKEKVFLGVYSGISRDSDIITGTVCLTKMKEGNFHVPLPIARYLRLDKWQKRVELELEGYNPNEIPTPRDTEDILPGFAGLYKFCWLDRQHRLIESLLQVSNDFEFTIRTFMSKNGVYSGRFFVQKDVVCLNSVGLRRNNHGRKVSAAAFFDAKKIARNEDSKYISGVYLLAGITSFPKFGNCILERVTEENHDNEIESILESFKPQIHDIKTLKKNGLEGIYGKLLEMKKYEQKKEKDAHDEFLTTIESIPEIQAIWSSIKE